MTENYTMGEALKDLFGGVAELTKDVQNKEDGTPFTFSDISPELDAKLKDLAQNVAEKLFTGGDEKLSELYAEHERYHVAGEAPAHYPTKNHTVHAIQYKGKENLREVISFLMDHDISFAFYAGKLGVINGTPGDVEIQTLNEDNWVAYRADIDAHQLLGCRDFAFNYDLPADLQEKSDEPFEGKNSDELFDED